MTDRNHIARLARQDSRYAAVLYLETGDASLLPAGPAWTRAPGAYPDEHERHETAQAALDAAEAIAHDAFLIGDDAGVNVIFGGHAAPNEDRDPYPDVIVEVDDDTGQAVAHPV